MRNFIEHLPVGINAFAAGMVFSNMLNCIADKQFEAAFFLFAMLLIHAGVIWLLFKTK